MNKEEVISFLIRYERECHDSIIDRQHCEDWFSDLNINFNDTAQYMAALEDVIEKGAMIRNKISSLENDIETVQCMSCDETMPKPEVLLLCDKCKLGLGE